MARATVVSAVGEEVQLTEDSGKKMPLKNGGEIDLDVGLAVWGGLSSLLEQQPDHFRALLALARGEREGVSEKSIAYLKRQCALLADGSINPPMRDVLLSAYHETPDGPMLVSPFRLASQEDVRRVEAADDRVLEGMRRVLRVEDGRTR